MTQRRRIFVWGKYVKKNIKKYAKRQKKRRQSFGLSAHFDYLLMILWGLCQNQGLRELEIPKELQRRSFAKECPKVVPCLSTIAWKTGKRCHQNHRLTRPTFATIH